MKQIVWVILITLVYLISCSDDSGKPALQVEEWEVELGRIKFDSTYLISYKITNAGTRNLVIDTITASCGCTEPKLAKKIIQPRQSTIISAQFKPVDTGFFRKTLVLRSNIDSIFTVVYFQGHASK